MSRIILEEQATPSTPSTNLAAVYPKSDGKIYSIDDAGNEYLLSGTSSATQAQQEAATIQTAAVTPGVQHWHPTAAKAWVATGFAANPQASYNTDSVTDSGTGTATPVWGNDFSTGNYCAVVSPQQTVTGASDLFSGQCINEKTVSTCTGYTWRVSDTSVQDCAQVMFLCFGDI